MEFCKHMIGLNKVQNISLTVTSKLNQYFCFILTSAQLHEEKSNGKVYFSPRRARRSRRKPE
jgi:hypothetical protein